MIGKEKLATYSIFSFHELRSISLAKYLQKFMVSTECSGWTPSVVATAGSSFLAAAVVTEKMQHKNYSGKAL